MLIEVMRMRIMNNEKKIQDAEKEAGGEIFKFAWPYGTLAHLLYCQILPSAEAADRN